MSMVGLRLKACARADIVTPPAGKVVIFLDTANGYVTQANPDGSFNILADDDLVAGRGIDITADSNGRLVISNDIVAGRGIDISVDSNNRLVISAI